MGKVGFPAPTQGQKAQARWSHTVLVLAGPGADTGGAPCWAVEHLIGPLQLIRTPSLLWPWALGLQGQQRERHWPKGGEDGGHRGCASFLPPHRVGGPPPGALPDSSSLLLSCTKFPPRGPLTQAQSLIRKVQLEKIPSGNPWTWGPQNVFVLCSLSSPKPGRSRVGSGFSCQAPMALVEPMKPKEQEKTPKDRPEGHSKNRSCIQLRNSPNLTRWGGRGADWASPQHEPMALFLASLPVLDLSAGVGA